MPTTTTQASFTFKNSGNKEVNDIAYPGPPFEFANHSYTFLLSPKTRFWRFGLRLSKTPDIQFNPESRYGNPEFKDLQIVVGDMLDRGGWSNPNKIELGHYHFIEGYEKQNPFVKHETYKELGLVECRVHYDISEKRLFVSYNAEGCEPFQQAISIGEYKYFQIFAWADWIDFELDCLIFDNQNSLTKSETGSYTIGNVVFRKGDMFQEIALIECDIVVLPTSSNGTIQPIIRDTALKLNIPLPGKASPGSIEIYGLDGDEKPSYWAWAYSVEAEIGSTPDIIKNICRRLLQQLPERKIKAVSLPLLGTGAGRLNMVEVAKIYCEIFNNVKTTLKFLVSININESYEKVIAHFQGLNKSSDVVNPFSKTPFFFRDKMNIDPVLGVKDLAKEIAEIILKMPANEQGAMIGIFGKWGRGKSYLIGKIWDQLSQDKSIRKIDFHAWKYQDTPGIWAYLYEQFAEEFYTKDKCWWDRFWRRIKLNYCRLGSRKLLIFIVSFSLSLTIAYLIPFTQKLNFFVKLVGAIGITGIISGFLIYFKYEKTARSLLKEYYSKITFSKLLGIQAEVQKELKCLIQTWCKKEGHKKIILFVEDIDRCSESKIIEIIDALRVMVEDQYISEKVIIVSAIDEDILQNAIKHKYLSLIDRDNKDELKKNLYLLTSQYLDKLFILGIKLGELSDRERDDFFVELTKDDREVREVQQFKHDEINFDAEPARSISAVDNYSGRDSNVRSGFKVNEIDVGTEGEAEDKVDTVDQNSQKSDGKISPAEVEILRECLKNHPNITPRQIRIFYYRYLIAKSLLISQYIKNKQFNVWLLPDNCRLFTNLLIEYSKFEGRSKLTQHKIDASKNLTPKMKVHMYKNQIVSTIDYRELLNTLDVIIAY